MAENRNIVVIGVGNPDRGDDAAGWLVADRVARAAPQGVAVVRLGGEPSALIDAWQGTAAAIVIDAVVSGAEPGTLHRLDATAEEIPREMFRCSTHGFGVAEAVELARALHELPPRLVIHGIEAHAFTPGAPPSPEVESALDALTGRVLAEIAAQT
jgi:hydrogenase maturation protease